MVQDVKVANDVNSVGTSHKVLQILYPRWRNSEIFRHYIKKDQVGLQALFARFQFVKLIIVFFSNRVILSHCRRLPITNVLKFVANNRNEAGADRFHGFSSNILRN